MLETIRGLKADLESLKADNVKLMNAKSYQKEINELILKHLTDPPENNGQNSCSTGNKRKWALQSGSNEETTDNIPVLTRELKNITSTKWGISYYVTKSYSHH